MQIGSLYQIFANIPNFFHAFYLVNNSLDTKYSQNKKT